MLLEVEDECGGLPVEKPTTCSGRSNRRSADRTGLGGWDWRSAGGAPKANDGRISTRNSPEGHGCVFIIDLPRAPTPVRETTGTLNTQLGIQWEATNEIQFRIISASLDHRQQR